MKVYLVEEGVILESAEAGTPEELNLCDKAEAMSNEGAHVYITYEKRK